MPGGLIVSKEGLHPLVKTFGGIDRIEDFAIAFFEDFRIHYGDDIALAIHIIPRVGMADAAFSQASAGRAAFQQVPEAARPWRLRSR